MIDAQAFISSHHPVIDDGGVVADKRIDKSDKSSERADEIARCMKSALRILDASAKSVQGMTKALAAKNHAPDVVEKVVSRLEESGLLNDTVLADALVRRALNKHMGPLGVRADLIKRGIDPVDAQRLVDDARARGEFFDSAQALVEESLAKTEGLERQTRLRRLWSAAQRKGHLTSDINEALRNAEKSL
jgi:regulatory protein